MLKKKVLSPGIADGRLNNVKILIEPFKKKKQLKNENIRELNQKQKTKTVFLLNCK